MVTFQTQIVFFPLLLWISNPNTEFHSLRSLLAAIASRGLFYSFYKELCSPLASSSLQVMIAFLVFYQFNNCLLGSKQQSSIHLVFWLRILEDGWRPISEEIGRYQF